MSKTHFNDVFSVKDRTYIKKVSPTSIVLGGPNTVAFFTGIVSVKVWVTAILAAALRSARAFVSKAAVAAKR